MKKEIYINGRIIGAEGDFSQKEAMVVGDGKFLFFGKNEDAEKFADESSSVINLYGKFVAPKFYDAHLHLIEGGLSLERLDLSNVRSKKEFQEKLYCFSKKNEDDWIIGMNWTEKNFRGEVPEKSWVDKVLPDRPVILYRMDLHTALLNSRALEIAGIDKNFRPPDDGKIERIEGETTGIVKDAALFYVNKFIPEPSLNKKLSALKRGIEEAEKFGVVGVHEMLFDIGNLDVYRKLCDEKFRDNFHISISIPIEKVNEFADKDLQLCHNIKIVGVKGFADGSLGAKTAWFFKPYKGQPENFGLQTGALKSGSLLRNAIIADKMGLQISIHAIGDRAVNEVLNIYEKVREENSSSDISHRIEHAQHVLPDDIKRFRELNITASVQPYHLYYDKAQIIKLRGVEELENSFPVKKFLEQKVAVAFGTDFPVVSLNPLKGIKLITGGYHKEIGNVDSITIQQAIKCYSENSSKAMISDKDAQLKIGNKAEFIEFALD